MKKLIMILTTAAAMTAISCGDGRTARDRENDDLDNTELAEPDTTTMERDTTSLDDRDDLNRNDDLNDVDESGVSEPDTIQ